MREWLVILIDVVLMFYFLEYIGFCVERNFCEDVFLGLVNF